MSHKNLEYLFVFRPDNLAPNRIPLLDVGTSTPKRGIGTTPRLTPRISVQYLHTQEQLASSLQASYYFEPLIRAIGIMDVGQLHTDIHSAQQSGTHSLEIITILSGPDADPRWSLYGTGLLHYDGHVWVPDVNDLRLRIFLYRITSVRTRLQNPSE